MSSFDKLQGIHEVKKLRIKHFYNKVGSFWQNIGVGTQERSICAETQVHGVVSAVVVPHGVMKGSYLNPAPTE
jgi:hypothetical protein